MLQEKQLIKQLLSARIFGRGGKNMTVQEYLSKIRTYDTMIQNKDYDYYRLLELTKGLSTPPSDRDKVISSPKGNSLCNGVIELVEIENEIHNLIQARKFIISQIETLSLSNYKILYHKYVMGQTGKEIMIELNYNSRSAYSLQLKKALREFEKLYGNTYKNKR
jgi:hypothetical protein